MKKSRWVVLWMCFVLSACGDRVHRMVVSVPDQKMVLFKHEKPIAEYLISTSKFGLGDQPGTNHTPIGRLSVAKKIGGDQPSGMKFKSRIPTGEIVPPNSPGRDPIVTRILWLKGHEKRNRNTFRRYIYIHGTPEESKLGTPASYGCIRMSSRDIIELYDLIGKGAKVDVVTHPIPRSSAGN